MSSELNDGKSVDITTLSKEQKVQAFHDWAEGCPELEELFLICDANGIITTGSCSGDPKYHDRDENDIDPPYISMLIDDSQEEYLKSIYDKLVVFQENCSFDLSINPDTEKMMFTVDCNLDNRGKVFSMISQAIKEPRKEIESIDAYNRFKNAFDKMHEIARGTEMEKDIEMMENCRDSDATKKIKRALILLKTRFLVIAEKIYEKVNPNKRKELNEPQATVTEEDIFRLTGEQLDKFNKEQKLSRGTEDTEKTDKNNETPIHDDDETLR